MKRCFCCGRILPIDSFYKHQRMSDGHLNKCKDCVKKSVRERTEKLMENPEYIERERERGREKYKRLNYRERNYELRKAKQERFVGLRTARRRFPDISKELELHHWNYNRPKSLIALPRRLHHKLHAKIQLNIDEGVYYYMGKKLSTIDEHLAVIRGVCEQFGFSYNDITVYDN